MAPAPPAAPINAASMAVMCQRVVDKVVDLVRTGFTESRPAHNSMAGALIVECDTAQPGSLIAGARASYFLGYDYARFFINLQTASPAWLPVDPQLPAGLLVNRDGVAVQLIHVE